MQNIYTNRIKLLAVKRWPELQERALEASVVTVTETWLRFEDCIEVLSPLNFCPHRANRCDGRIDGVVLLMIADHLEQFEIDSFISPNVKVVCARCRLGKEVLLVAVYRSPFSETVDNENFIAFIQDNMADCLNLYILGNFNAPEIN